ncbi:MAG: hypothetical protein IPJ94_29135 [Chloroflexi bacterium]|nr:hypothetical protein [Chloroflexota bacterium]
MINRSARAGNRRRLITWAGTASNGETITFTFTADQTGDWRHHHEHSRIQRQVSGRRNRPGQFHRRILDRRRTFIYHDLEDVVMPGEGLFLAGDFNAGTPPARP